MSKNRELLNDPKVTTTVERLGQIQIPKPVDAKQAAHELKTYEQKIRHGRDILARDIYQSALENGKRISRDEAYRLAMESVERVTKNNKGH